MATEGVVLWSWSRAEGGKTEAAVWDQPFSSNHSSAGTSTPPAHCGIGVYPARW